MNTKRDEEHDGFTADERAAMKERAAELRASARRAKSADKAAAELQDALDAIEKLPPADRELATRVHAIIADAAPALAPKTWYGMPAYALDGKVVVFFQGAEKFKARYSTLGFNDPANLDDGAMWATSFAIVAIGEAEEARIRSLLAAAIAQ